MWRLSSAWRLLSDPCGSWPIAWLLAYRRLAVRYDRQATTVLGLLRLACSLICVRFLQRAELAAMGL